MGHADRLLRQVDPAGRAAAGAVDPDVEYFCPMHPTVIRDNPKDKCPICFMPLVEAQEGNGARRSAAGGRRQPRATFALSRRAGRRQTWPVDYQPLTKEITAVGYVEFNERGQRTVSARVAGRIDKLFANETGQMVQAGDELALALQPRPAGHRAEPARRQAHAAIKSCSTARARGWSCWASTTTRSTRFSPPARRTRN